MGCLSGLLAALLVAGALPAQSPPLIEQEAARVRQWLDSPVLAEKAWGAYLAGRLHSDELGRRLIQEIRAASEWRDALPAAQEYAYVAVLLDAAIEAEIAVPAAVLEPFAERWTDAVLVLAARNPDSEDFLLSLRSDRRNEVWLAANNLLGERASQRWYDALLAEIAITHRFTVIDADRGAGSGGSIGVGFCGDGVIAAPNGFPPLALYQLSETARRGSVVLAEGPRTVFYKRTVVATGKQAGFGSCGSLLDRPAVRIEYLARLHRASVDETLRLFHGQTEVRYSSGEDFRRQVEETLAAQEQGVRAFLRAIDENGLRTPPLRLRIVPEVEDTRQRPSGSLPPVAPREFDLD